jgi:hypothetical protein
VEVVPQFLRDDNLNYEEESYIYYTLNGTLMPDIVNLQVGTASPETAGTGYLVTRNFPSANSVLLGTLLAGPFLMQVSNGDKVTVESFMADIKQKVEILDSGKNLVEKLKVAKMVDPGVLSVTETSVILDPEKDIDHFYIRVVGGAVFGSGSAKIATVDNPDAAYNDGETEIEFVVDGADLISKSMILVSDDVDDGHTVGGIGDGGKNDRTHKIQLGGKLIIKSLKLGNSKQDVGVKIPVQVIKKVHINAVILNATIGGAPVIAAAVVEADLKIARERYAQVGIDFTWGIQVKDPPAGVNLDNGILDNLTEDVPSTEENALFNALGTPAADDIHIFFVSYIDTVVNRLRAGHTFAALGNAVISVEAKSMFTVSHEIGHILGQIGHNASDILLMRGGGTSKENKIESSKRMTPEQETTFQGSIHAK